MPEKNIHKELTKSREKLQYVRFSGDNLVRKTDGLASLRKKAHRQLALNELKITSHVTPTLFDGLSIACKRLGLPTQCVSAFVYSSSDVQAECIATDPENCILRFSSALIELLELDEFCFVCGHELGHFVFEHGILDLEHTNRSIEIYMQKRAQEISVDRVGLLACESLSAALSALMKTVSGLSNRHLRFDIGAFIAQLSEVDDPSKVVMSTSTHPSILVRSRALLWFSMAGIQLEGRDTDWDDSIEILDSRVSKDLEKFVDRPTRRAIDEAVTNFEIWLSACRIVDYGKFGKKDQQTFYELFGRTVLGQMSEFVSSLSKNDAEAVVHEKMKSSRDQIEALMPIAFAEICQAAINKIDAHFPQKL